METAIKYQEKEQGRVRIPPAPQEELKSLQLNAEGFFIE